MRLGILGGTFDPIHLGHLRVAIEICEELEMEKVFLIPGALPPHKDTRPISEFHHRLEMARIAATDSTVLEVLDIEGRRQGFSYSIETLQEIHQLFQSSVELFFIIGMDAFLEIRTWKEYKRLFDYAHFIVIKRPGILFEKIEPFLFSLGIKAKKEGKRETFVVQSGNLVIYKETTLMDISSTRIREMVATRQSIHFLVPESVRSYIMEKGLYRVYGNSG